MKVLLDMGHTLSGADTGTIGCGKKEQECTREIGYKLKNLLEDLGQNVIIVSTDYANTVGKVLP